jgi:hypothetical protein
MALRAIPAFHFPQCSVAGTKAITTFCDMKEKRQRKTKIKTEDLRDMTEEGRPRSGSRFRASPFEGDHSRLGREKG